MIKEVAIAAREFNNAVSGDIVAYRDPQIGIGKEETNDFLWLRVQIPDAEAAKSFTERDANAKRRFNIPFVRLKSIMPAFDASKIVRSETGNPGYQPFINLNRGTLLWNGTISILPNLNDIAVDTGRRAPPRADLNNNRILRASAGLTLLAARDILRLPRRRFSQLIAAGLSGYLLFKAQQRLNASVTLLFNQGEEEPEPPEPPSSGTSRMSGINESVKTYGSAGQGRDYTALGTWEAATDNNNVSLAVSPVLECYADAASFADSATLSGSTNDDSYFRIIRPAPGHRHNGTPNSGVKFAPTNDDGANIVEANSQVQDLIFTVNLNIDGNFYGILLQGGSSKVIGCIVYDCANTFVNRSVRGIGSTVTGTVICNCLVHNVEEFGILISGGVASVYNNTVVDVNSGAGGSTGIHILNSTAVVKNCLSSGTGSVDFSQSGGTITGSSHNASGDATGDDFGVTGSRVSQTFTFVNSGSNDFHLHSSDVGARGFGINLTDDPTFPFGDDIDAALIQNWSIGFDSVSGTGVLPLFTRYYQQMLKQQTP